MQFSTLLEALIKVGKIQKQALSTALAYSPSEISKYLAGSRLPSPAASQEWIERCAAFFAQTFWDNGLGDGFTSLFPMLIPFRKQQDLQALVRAALEDAYRLSASNAAQPAEENRLLMGWEEMIRALVLSQSRAARNTKHLNSYFSLEMYLNLLQRRALPLPASTWQGTCDQHVLVSPLGPPDTVSLPRLGLLVEHWQTNHERINLKFYKGPLSLVPESAYVSEQFVCMLVNMMSQTPLGVLMRSPRYLMEYDIVNKMLHTDPISYTEAEGLQALANKEEDILEMVKGCEGIFAFDSVSFFANAGHLQQVPGDEGAKALLSHAFEALTHLNVPMVVTTRAVEHFSNTGEALVPLLGTLKLQPEESASYMMAYTAMMQDPERLKVHITKRSFPQCTILVLKRHLMVLIPFPGTGGQRLLLLPRSICEQAVEELFYLLKTESTPVTQELWEHFMRYLPSVRRSMESQDLR